MCSNVESNLSWTCLVSGPLNFEHPSVLLFCLEEVSFHISTTWWVSLLVDQKVPEGTYSQVLRSTSIDSYRLRASTFSVFKIGWFCTFLVYYTILFGLSLCRYFRATTFQLLDYFVWQRITDEGSVPGMRIRSILLIQSGWKWCTRLSKLLFSYINYLVSITAGGSESPRGHM